MKICLLDSGYGIIPFIKEIILQQKKNDYLLMMDSDFFPYGNKSEEELYSHFLSILEELSDKKIDTLLICCNTLSYIYLKYQPATQFQIKTILEINLKCSKKLLTTTLLSKRINSIDGRNLALEIENNNIIEIINIIKGLKQKEFVLSCTHYPIIKAIFKYYKYDVISNENVLISSISSTTSSMEFSAKYDVKEKVLQFFPKLRIIVLSR